MRTLVLHVPAWPGHRAGHVDDVIAGNQSEVHEPIGGYFVWEERPAEPLLLIKDLSGRHT